jgi:hypothetical protein
VILLALWVLNLVSCIRRGKYLVQRGGDVTSVEGKFHNEELHNLYSSPDIFRVIKSRNVRWVGHVACMRDE